MAVSCLLVDDSEDFLVSATRLLTLQGIRVVGRASSGAEALRLAEALSPDVALVDVELGAEDGIEVSRRLTSGSPSMIVILISVRDRDELGDLIAGSGAVGFLRKDTLGAAAVTSLIAESRKGGAEPEPPRLR